MMLKTMLQKKGKHY